MGRKKYKNSFKAANKSDVINRIRQLFKPGEKSSLGEITRRYNAKHGTTVTVAALSNFVGNNMRYQYLNKEIINVPQSISSNYRQVVWSRI